MKKRLRKKWLKRLGGERLTRTALRSTMSAANEASSGCIPRAEIYKGELSYVMRCILERPSVETGGELFGFWKDDGTPVVVYAIGPGPRANHQYTFFNQDLDYLTDVGKVLTERYGLEHIGEWHSHHRLGLAVPSGHDAMTLANGVRTSGRNRFLLCVGTCSSHSASLGGFLFSKGNGSLFDRLDWTVREMESPYRHLVDADPDLVGRLVHPLALQEIRNGQTKA